MSLSKEQLSTIYLALAALIWGVGFVAQRAAIDYMGPFTFNGLRFGLGGLSLIPIARIIEKDFRGLLNRNTLTAGLAAGTVLFAGAGLQQWGIAVTGSASKAGFITGMYIVLVPILGIFLKRKAPRFVWLGALCATIGLYFLSVPAYGLQMVDLGSALLLVGAVCWALHILVVDRFVAKVKPLSFSIAQCLVCAILSLAFAFSFESPQLSQVAAGYLPLMFSAFVSVCIAYTLQVIGQQHVPPGRSAVIFSMESIIAAIGEALLLGAFLDGRGYMGGGLIFAGILISQLRRSRKGAANA